MNEIHGLAVDKGDVVVVSGLSDSPNFPMTAEAFRHRGGRPTQPLLRLPFVLAAMDRVQSGAGWKVRLGHKSRQL